MASKHATPQFEEIPKASILIKPTEDPQSKPPGSPVMYILGYLTMEGKGQVPCASSSLFVFN